MDELQRHIEELLFSDAPVEPIEVHLKNIAVQISELEEEKKEHPDAIDIDITLRSLRQLQEGYLALAKEEEEGVPEIRQWASGTRDREPEMAAVGAIGAGQARRLLELR